MATATNNSPSKGITINPDYFGPGDGLYIIPSGDGYSTLGFDRVMELASALAKELGQLDLIPWTDERGTIEAYEKYRALVDIAHERHKKSGFRSKVELTPELIGLEGRRVEVVDSSGEKRRFTVGRSTGWIPIHLEIKTSRSRFHDPVSGAPFQSVRVIR